MNIGLVQNDTRKEEKALAEVKFTHSLSIGQTGSGKTTSFIYPNLIKRMELGHGILFFDIKGSEHKAIKVLADKSNRLKDVIEIGKPWGKDINILSNFNESTFSKLLESVIGSAKDSGSNAYFYNAAKTLGLTIYSILNICTNITQEINECGIKASFKLLDTYSLQDIFDTVVDTEHLYSFIQSKKEFLDNIDKFLKTHGYLLSDLSHKELFHNIILNKISLEKYINSLSGYDVDKDDRDNQSIFDRSLISVINTLKDSLGFMITASSKYISNKEDPLCIVEALQNNKIVIINVRVIPDQILELLLEQLFNQLIDLNLKSKESRYPVSIFIDEAQRLINKDIPLDVLRSSKVDVLLAVQSELQLISKFGSVEDWQQISINLAQKFAFRSSLIGQSQLSSFYPNTAEFKTFEFTKEYDNKIYKAIPEFIDTKELENTEYKYQHDILKLKDIENDEYLIYDVQHFEKEREVVVTNVKTKKIRYKKLFSKYQDNLIQEYITKNIYTSLDTLESLINDIDNIPREKVVFLQENFGVVNEYGYNQSKQLQTMFDDTIYEHYEFAARQIVDVYEEYFLTSNDDEKIDFFNKCKKFYLNRESMKKLYSDFNKMQDLYNIFQVGEDIYTFRNLKKTKPPIHKSLGLEEIEYLMYGDDKDDDSYGF